MNIKRAKEEIRNTIEAYLLKNEYGEYEIPVMAQRPVFLIGAPGIGKTQIMEQISRECKVGLVSYTITHHTRQSAIGLPFISRKNFDGKEMAVTDSTPIFRNLFFSDIIVQNATAAAGFISGLPEMPVEGLFIDNMTVNMASGTSIAQEPAMT